MALAFPDFDDQLLEQFTACANFHADDASRLTGIGRIGLQAQVNASGGPIWIRLVCEPDDEGVHGHVHFDIGREFIYEEVKSLTTVTPEELADAASRFFGQTMDVRFIATYSIMVEVLPRHGLISALLGIETESCGHCLALDGASMSIVGDLFTRLRWDLDEETDAVEVELTADTQTEYTTNYLPALIDVMRDGLECFVLETGEARKYAGNRPKHKKTLPDIAEA